MPRRSRRYCSSISRSRSRSRSRSNSRSRRPHQHSSRRRSRSNSPDNHRSLERHTSSKNGRSRYSSKDDERAEKGKEKAISEEKKKKNEERESFISRDAAEISKEDSGPVKANVTESNGEISCSIEETNRIRISLGLKPLKLETKEKKNEVSLIKTKEELLKEEEVAKVQLRIERSKKKRELHAKVQGESLGDLLSRENECNSTLDWVKRSRSSAVEEERLLAEKRAKLLSEQDTVYSYESKDLRGVKVTQSATSLDEGEAMILTLKDSYVLEEDGTNVAEVEDVLENVNTAEEHRRKERERKQKRARQPIYSAYDDEEFVTPGEKSKAKILSQYDEENDTEDVIVLNNTGGNVVQQEKKEKPIQKDVIILAMKQQRAVEEYYTNDEVVQFSKPKKMRKKKNKRIKDTSLIQQLEIDASTNNDDDDHGRRETKKDLNSEMKKKEKENRIRFEQAREKANKVAESVLEKQNETFEDEYYDQIDSSISRMRRLNQIKEKSKIDHVSQIANQVLSRPSEMDVESSSSTMNTKRIQFNDSTDFQARIKHTIEERRVKGIEEEEKEEKNKTIIDNLKEDERMDIEEEKVSCENDKGIEEEEEEWGQEQPLVLGGMAATLALLRKTGDLRESDQPRMAGRSNDRREKVDMKVKNGVKLEYKDEFGRSLTQKEAFRQLSYKFHGQKPGKKKQEQRLKKLKEEIQMDKMLSGEGSKAAMKVLQKRQRAAGKAYVVLGS